MKPTIQRYPNVQELSIAAADLICQLAEKYVKERGYFTLALSGGSTPRTLYGYLAQEPYSGKMPWRNTHLFWGDERYVSPDHPDSNFLMASQTLIEQVPIPPENVHRIPTETDSPESSAKEYEAALRQELHVFDSLSAEQGVPVFDVILLGMGKDGHTASLFPDSPVLDEKKRWVAAAPVPKMNPPVRRITLTFPVINAAKHAIFLIAGAEKQPVMQAILDDPEQAKALYPTARVEPGGKLLWLVV